MRKHTLSGQSISFISFLSFLLFAVAPITLAGEAVVDPGAAATSDIEILCIEIVPAEYFRAEPGDTWSYLVDGSQTGDVTVLSAPNVINGIATSVFRSSAGNKEFYTADGEGVRLHGLFYPKVQIQGLGKVNLTLTFMPPVVLAGGVADIGETFNTSGTARTNKLPRAGIVDFAYEASFTVEGFDTITVPAGTFDVVRLSGTLTIEGQPETQTVELAKGIGIIRSVIAAQGNPTETSELISTNVALFSLDASSLPDGEQGAGYKASIGINGTNPSYEVKIISGSLPAGLSIDNAGHITGIPGPKASTKNFTVQVSQNGSYVKEAFTIKIYKSLAIKTGNLKSGTSGKSYSATIKAGGGSAPYKWSLAAGSLPTGFDLNPSTGSITGVTTDTGTFNPAIRVIDSLGGQAEKTFTLTIK